MSWWIKKAAQSHTNSWLQKSLIHREYIHYGASDTFSDAHSHSVTHNPIKLRQMSCMFNWKQHVMLNVTLFGFVPSYDQKKSMVGCCCFFYFTLPWSHHLCFFGATQKTGLLTAPKICNNSSKFFIYQKLDMYNQYINFALQVDWWCWALKFQLVLLKCEVSGHCAPSKKKLAWSPGRSTLHFLNAHLRLISLNLNASRLISIFRL